MMTLDEIISTLTTSNHEEMPREALAAAIERREEITPALLASLDYAEEHLADLLSGKLNYYLYDSAIYLLAQFREHRAFPPLIKLLTHDDGAERFLFADVLTEDMPTILSSVYDGDLPLLDNLVKNPAASHLSRGAALDTYELLFRDGRLSRAEIIAYLREILQHGLAVDANRRAEMWMNTNAVIVVVDARLEELLPEVKLLYDAHKVEFMMYGVKPNPYECFLMAFHCGRGSCHRQLQIDDALAELKKWYWKPTPRREVISWEALNEEIHAQAEERENETATNKRYWVRNQEQLPPTVRVGANQPCPCGSGKKYKKCCGRGK
jgi:hypothetical protein